MGIGTSVLLAPKNTGPLLFRQSQRKRSPPLHTSGTSHIHPGNVFSQNLLPLFWFLLADPVPYPFPLPPRSFHCDLWNSAPRLTNLSAFLPSSLNIPSTPVLTGTCFPPEDREVKLLITTPTPQVLKVESSLLFPQGYSPIFIHIPELLVF